MPVRPVRAAGEAGRQTVPLLKLLLQLALLLSIAPGGEGFALLAGPRHTMVVSRSDRLHHSALASHEIHKKEDRQTAHTSMSIKRHIPNALTVSRVLAIPVFVGLYVTGQRVAAVGVFVGSCLTDWLDGYLARLWRISSPFGAFLDPVADKLLVCSALVLLLSESPSFLVALPVMLILLREIAVSALREWMAERGLRAVVKVGWLGKAKTASQMVALLLLLVVGPGTPASALPLGVKPFQLFAAGMMSLYTSAALAVMSAGQYLAAAWPALCGRSETRHL